MAETTPPAGGADTLAPVPSTTETSVIGRAATAQPTEDTAIRPFSFRASDEELADLKRRIEVTRWPDRETVNDDTQGVQLATMRKLADYWATEYDWRKCEAR